MRRAGPHLLRGIEFWRHRARVSVCFRPLLWTRLKGSDPHPSQRPLESQRRPCLSVLGLRSICAQLNRELKDLGERVLLCFRQPLLALDLD